MPEITKLSSPQIGSEVLKRIYLKGIVIIPSEVMEILDGKKWLLRGVLTLYCAPVLAG